MPPIVSFSLAYIGGLLAGSVLRVPVAFALVCCLLVAAVATPWAALGRRSSWAASGPRSSWAASGRRRPWAALGRPWLAVLALTVGAGWAAAQLDRARHGTSCGVTWPRGTVAAIVRWHDAPSARGTATASVLHGSPACHGGVRLRVETLSEVGVAGTRAVVIGTHRGAGVLRVSHLKALRGRRDARYMVRDAIAGRIARLYGPRAPLVEALVLGRKDGIPPDVRDTFVGSGLAHLLAISGLHVGIVAGWLLFVLRSLGAPRPTALAACAVWGYVALLGFPAPATRAATFVTVYALSRQRQRHPPMTAVLAVAGLVLAALDPSAVTAVGAWLSAAAVWGVWRARRLVPERWARQPVAGLLAASLGATAATAPITAFAFGQVAPVGLIANLVAVPLAGLTVPGVFGSLFLGDLMAGGAGLALAGLETVAALAARAPGAQVVGVPGLSFAAPWLAVLLVFAYLTRRPLEYRTGTVLLLRVSVAAAAASWLGVVARELSSTVRRLEIHVMDVGQGDAIAVRSPHGRWLLVDGGPPGHKVVPPLRRLGVRRLAALVVSHGDADHLGGVPAAVRAFAPELVVEPAQPLPSALYQEFLMSVDAAGVPWRPARAGDTLRLDSMTVAVLHPTPDWLARQLEPNDNSLVVHLRYGCFDALFTGDVGEAAERRLEASIGPVDVLKVGHHGSNGSSSAPFLDAVRPKVAVISVGRGNRYGHPAPAALQRLQARGAWVLRTDRDGVVTIRTDGRYLEVQQGRVQSFWETIPCRIRRWSPSSASFWSKSACTRAQPVSLPICSTTSPSRGR